MFQTIKEKAFNAKTAAVALVLSAATAPAFAQQASTIAADIVKEVEGSLDSGASIATAVVLGLFAIWGIKLLWRSK